MPGKSGQFKKKVSTTSQIATAPSSDRLETRQNELFEDVCGEIFCNHLKIYTHMLIVRQPSYVCHQRSRDMALKVHFLKSNISQSNYSITLELGRMLDTSKFL